MIIGTGLDLIEIERVEAVIRRHPDRFLPRVFTPAEIAYCRGQPHPGQHFAGRFAGKEAVLKALGTGWAEGIAWREVEIVRRPGAAPLVQLHGRARAAADRRGIRRVHLSLTHSRGQAAAVAVADDETDRPAPEARP